MLLPKANTKDYIIHVSKMIKSKRKMVRNEDEIDQLIGFSILHINGSPYLF